jgi:hypothetical protein
MPTHCQAAAQRLQRALLAFFALAAVFLIAVYIAAPAIYVQTLAGSASTADPRPLAATLLLAAIVAFVGLLIVGVLRRWRWLFWLVLVAFILSALQIPAAALELAGILPVSYPAWYIVARALVAAIQLALGIAMLRVAHRCGAWGQGRRLATRGERSG